MSEKIPHVWTPTETMDWERAVNQQVYEALLAYWEDAFCAVTPYKGGGDGQVVDGALRFYYSLSDDMEGHGKYAPITELLEEFVDDWRQEAKPLLVRLRDEIDAMIAALDITAPKE